MLALIPALYVGMLTLNKPRITSALNGFL